METILQARGLKKYYGKGETQVRALGEYAQPD